MKTIIFSILTIFSSLALAGGSGGGGVMATTGKTMQDGNGGGTMKPRVGLAPEIVFNLGKQNGLVKFAYGQLVDNQWQIQNIEIAENDLITNVSVIEALENSKILNCWSEIK